MKYHSPGNRRVKEALEKLGAKKIKDEVMTDVYFSHPSKDLGKTDESIRLRRSGNHAELTYKGPRKILKTAKAREEITVKVDDPLALQQLFERIGFEKYCTIRKHRSSYLLHKIKVEVDAVEELGEFVELEMLTESPEKGLAHLDSARKTLALNKIEHRTYLEMMLNH